MSIGIIGGTGALALFEPLETVALTTPFGPPSARPVRIELDTPSGPRTAWFMARHGNPHRIPPHRVNYRANLHALKALGCRRVIAVSAVGGVDPALATGTLVAIDQVIDYTWGREHTFSEGPSAPLRHVEFARPFDGEVRRALIEAASETGETLVPEGCYGATQGPRLESAAEVRRLEQDGCTVVGMTAMPEAGLARELGLDYANLCVVANPAAGVSDTPISEEEIHRELAAAMDRVRSLLLAAVARLPE